MRLLALVVLAVGVLWAVPAHAQERHTLYGFHMDISYEPDADARQAVIDADAGIGSQIGRNTFSMALLEPAPGQYDWSRIDSIIDRMQAANVERLFVVSGSPAWANGSDDRFAIPQDPVLFGLWVSEYVDFMRQAALRYPHQRWELWNEPNEYYFWRPGPNAGQYLTWYTAVRDAILQADPTALVSVGGLTGLSQSCCTRGVEFLRQLLASGIEIDFMAIHPYTKFSPDAHVKWEDNFDDIGLIHDTLETAGRHDVPIWITEWGWDVNTLDEDTLAAYLKRSLVLIRTRYKYVTIACYFQDYGSTGDTYGVFDPALQPRPSALAFKDFVAHSK
ncbi:MAG: cellulase family glycosylhydrolase [Pseudonocardia sp.]|nr:cellulase family glycosylhydrolase [Pseudonocardia sp.]